jgi:hypothetical protein
MNLSIVRLFATLIVLAPLVIKAAEHDVEQVITSVQTAVGKAAYMHETGTLGSGFTHQVSTQVTLQFSEAEFDTDLRRAFAVMDKLTEIQVSQAAEASQQPAPRQLTRMEQLMQAESQTNRYMPPAQVYVTDFDIMSAYRGTREARLAARDQAADADAQMIIAERQMAEQELVLRKQREQALTDQASAWQAEMDRQAVESATAMKEWKAQNGFGAHVRRIFTGVISTGLGAFTGGLSTVVANDLAGKAINGLFGDKAGRPGPRRQGLPQQ